jgi:hypothetical protein
MNFVISMMFLISSVSGFFAPFDSCHFCNDVVETFNGSVSKVDNKYVLNNSINGYNCIYKYDDSCDLDPIENSKGLVSWKYAVHSLHNRNYTSFYYFYDNITDVLDDIVNNKTADYICNYYQFC